MSSRNNPTERDLFVAATELPRSPGHPFYQKLNKLFAKHKFDAFLEEHCAPYYSEGGRPSIPPGVYFRMLFAGYFEGIGSEREICWRIADSLSLREFVGLELSERVPDHSSFTKIRQRFDEALYELVHLKVLEILKLGKLLKGKTLGVDATTLQADASMRSLVRRDTSESYGDYIKRLAEEEKEEEGEPGEVDAKEARNRDKKRKGKSSNKDWQSPTDSQAQITKMKAGNTRLAHKVEHAVDMDTGAVVTVEIYDGAAGDSASLPGTVRQATVNVGAVCDGVQPDSVVADAGYHSDASLAELDRCEVKPYLAEKSQKRVFKPHQKAAEKRYKRNRKLNRNSRGKRLQRSRGEKVERTFQHLYDRGRLRRLTLRGKSNNRKRLLIQAAGYNLGLLLTKLIGKATPKAYGELFATGNCFIIQPFSSLLLAFGLWRSSPSWMLRCGQIERFDFGDLIQPRRWKIGGFSTAC